MAINIAIPVTSKTSVSNTEQSTFTAWLVLMCGALFFFYEYAQMNMFNAIDHAVREAFNLNATDLGRLAAYYAYANILFLFPAGMLLDRFSTRTIILTAMTICVVSTFGFSQAQSVQFAEGCRFLSGIGGAFCFLSCIRLASRWFPPRHMALATGVFVTIGMLGGAIAQAPLTILVEQVGWRHALMLDATVGVMVIFIIAAVVRDYPSRERQHYLHGHDVLQKMGIWRSLRLVLSNPQNFLGGLYTSLLNLPIALLGAVWGIPYLQYARGFDATHAAWITTMLFVGTIFGSSIVGWISDRIMRRRMPMIVGAIFSLALVSAIIYLPITSFFTYLVLFFSLGLITSSQVVSYPMIAESNPSYLTGTSMSIASSLILGGYAVFQPLFGLLMDINWQGETLNGLRIYTQHDFNLPMLVFPVAFVIALLAAMLTKETYCKPAAEE